MAVYLVTQHGIQVCLSGQTTPRGTFHSSQTANDCCDGGEGRICHHKGRRMATRQSPGTQGSWTASATFLDGGRRQSLDSTMLPSFWSHTGMSLPQTPTSCLVHTIAVLAASVERATHLGHSCSQVFHALQDTCTKATLIAFAIDWLIDQINWSIDCSFIWLIDRSFIWSIIWSIHLINCTIDSFDSINRSFNRSIDWLIDRTIDCLIDCSIDCSIDGFINRSTADRLHIANGAMISDHYFSYYTSLVLVPVAWCYGERPHSLY